MTNAQKKLKYIISEYTLKNVNEISLNSNLKDIFDSLDFIQLTMEIEEEFSISFQDSDFEQIKTIQDLLNLIELRIKQQKNYN